ncbi:non-specific lipid-transfer protein-like protein At2g13820 [Abrus precatorius]|uniref:Non-specific lipid-transfer protein-like protein At2g13820 n=1 Tax=Abrus precatorius TaxID=3816 RepID=A0A8B8M4A6_ABRPR|nr:non-specific lipid-transfer protein-like protein At2g13820 [Abrus precatorius]
MERFVCLVVVFAMATAMAAPAYAQVTTPCNASMINNLFSPCVNFLTNSSGNGTSPSAQCCNSMKSLTSGGMDCLCLIVTGNVPFRIPINRTLAISLPRACNMPGLPVQCKSSPLPAPGPASLGPSLSPVSNPSSPSLSPEASSVLPSPVTPSLAPESDTTPPLLTPSSPSVDSDTPSATKGSGRSDLTPSSATSSYRLLPSFVLITLGFAVLKHR